MTCFAVVWTTNDDKCSILSSYVPSAGSNLKGLGHAILGNFSIDQVVIELTEITK